VNDLILKYTTLPAVGTKYYAVRGILDWRNNNSKVEPRRESDLLVMPKIATLSPAQVVTAAGGKHVVFSVQLDNPAPTDVTLAIQALPAELWDSPATSVSIPAGATSATFTLTTAATVDPTVTGSVEVVLYGGTVDESLKTSAVTLTTAALPALVSLTPAGPHTVVQGETLALTVTLDANALSDTLVRLSVDPATGFGSVPETVLVPKDQKTATFNFTAHPTADEVSGTITASLESVSKSVTASVVKPGLRVASVNAASPVMLPKGTKTFTVTINQLAPAEGVLVNVWVEPSSLGSIPVSTVKIDAGKKSADVTFTAGDMPGKGKLVASVPSNMVSGSIDVAPKVLISEFATQGANAAGTGSVATDEFIELYNPTDVEGDLSGWKLQYRSAAGPNYSGGFTLPAGSKIPARGYFLVTWNGYAGSVAGNASFTTSISMSATAGHVRLGLPGITTSQTDPLAVDWVGFGTAATAAEGSAPVTTIPVAAGSFERKALSSSDATSMSTGGADELKGNGQDSDNNAADFVARAKRDPQNASSPTEKP
jgi:hypothetical protein